MTRLSTVVLCLTLAIVSYSSNAAVQWQPIGPDGGDLFLVDTPRSDPATFYAHSVLAIFRSDDAATQWQPVHTADMRSGVIAVAYDPADSNHIFIATANRGVYESVDKGTNWTPCGGGLPPHPGAIALNYPVTSLAFDVNGSLFAGLGEMTDQSAPPAWVYRSDDGCENWQADGAGFSFDAPALTQKVTTLLSNAADGGLWATVYGAGVYRYDAGTWTTANSNLPASALQATFLGHDPADADSLLLGTESSWVYSTTDAGASWSSVPTPASLASLPVLPVVYDIAIDPANSAVRYVMTIDAGQSNETAFFSANPLTQTSGGGGYLSTDTGANWNNFPWRLLRMLFDPATTTSAPWPPHEPVTRSSVWYGTSFGANNLVKSVDGGATFQVANNGIQALVVNSVWRHPAPAAPYNELAFVASEAGLYLQRDGQSWEFLKAAANPIYTWSFAVDPNDANDLLFATGNPARSFGSDRGIYRASLSCFVGECQSVQLLSDVGTWRVVTSPAKPSHIYAATQEQGILYSDDAGANWRTLNTGLTLPQSITDLVLDASGNPLLASSRTSNGNFDLDPPQVWQPARDEAGTAYRYNGNQWTVVASISDAVYDLEGDPFDTDTYYAATADGVLVTTDGGAIWTTLLSDTLVNAIVADPLKRNFLYAATRDGVLRSSDGGNQWHDFSDDLRQLVVYSLSIDPVTGTLSAGTAGNSVYQLAQDPGPQPDIATGAESLIFDVVPVGFSDEATVTIRNAGEANLTLSGIDSDNAAFAVVDPGLPVILTPGNLVAVTIRFTPDTTGAITGQLLVSSDAATTPALVHDVSGTGRAAVPAAPDLKLDGIDGPLDVAFGATVNMSAQLSAGDYSGIDADFWVRQTRPDGSTHWLVQDDGWVESQTPLRFFVSKVFDHTEAFLSANLVSPQSGTHELYLAVDDNADNIFDGTWSDAGLVTFQSKPATLLVTPMSLDFGDTPATLDRTEGLGLINQGEADLIINALNFSNIAFDLLNPPTLPLNIAAGETVVLTATFSPPAPGAYNATLSVASNDQANPVTTVALSGNGTDPAQVVPDVKVNGSDSGVAVERGVQVSVTLQMNGGDYNGTQSDFWIRMTRPDNTIEWLVQGGGWVKSVSPQRFLVGTIADYTSPFLTINVTTPQTGATEVSFFVDDNNDGVFDATWSDTAYFTAYPAPPVIYTSATGLSYGDVAVGASATKYFGIVNSGEQDLVVDAISFGHAGFTLTNPPGFPATVVNGTPLIVSVKFAPQAAGSVSSRLTIDSNDPDRPQSILTLQGAGYEVATPQPVIQVDGNDSGLVISAGENRLVTISLDPNEHAGDNADWWLLRLKRNEANNGYDPTLIDAYQALLTEQNTVIVDDTSTLTAGQYVYVFGVDLNPNGQFDSSVLYLDTADLTVQ